ncbi:MAG: flippase, partial [Candidatus Njordarchaeales archaeon]
ASLIAYFVANILNSTKLYQLSGIHPFTWNYLKPIGISIILLALIYVLVSHFEVKLWILLIFLLIFLLSYFILLLLTKSFDKEDIEMFLAMEERMGANLKVVKGLLRRFV